MIISGWEAVTDLRRATTTSAIAAKISHSRTSLVNSPSFDATEFSTFQVHKWLAQVAVCLEMIRPWDGWTIGGPCLSLARWHCRLQDYLLAWPPPPFNPSEDNERLWKLKMSGEAGGLPGATAKMKSARQSWTDSWIFHWTNLPLRIADCTRIAELFVSQRCFFLEGGCGYPNGRHKPMCIKSRDSTYREHGEDKCSLQFGQTVD